MKELHPEEFGYVDTSGRGDTSTSSSLGSIMRHFQFPVPPSGKISREELLQENVRQLPRNNSWATGFQPQDGVTSGDLRRTDSPITQILALDVPGKTPLGNTLRNERPLANIPSLASPGTMTGAGDQNMSQDEGPSGEALVAADSEAITYDEDPWTDIPVEEGLSDGDHGLGSPSRANGPRAAPKEGFTTHDDNPVRANHPRPLSAHPWTSNAPDFSFLAPPAVHKPSAASGTRTPWHRRNRNGNSESHRSSVYGPGALAKKVQQAVMITVNVELDVLRLEMSDKFANQKAWFDTELKSSQIWTLRVEEENRKLRDDLAKERKRREGERGAVKAWC
ncbi:MAG: hypothetical protein Q9218_005645 [Villophora microphyllina]